MITHILFKYIQRNPARVSSVPISEASAQFSFGSESVWNIWTLCPPDGGSALPQVPDRIQIWALTWLPQNTDLVIVEPFARGRGPADWFLTLLSTSLPGLLLGNILTSWRCHHASCAASSVVFLSFSPLFSHWFFKQYYKTTYNIKKWWISLSVFIIVY